MNATMNDTATWLYEYFIQQGTLTLPGVGTFRIQRISAQIDFASKRMLPPSFTIRFDHRHDSPQREMFVYLSACTGMADWEAVRSVNNLAFEIKTKLLHGESVSLEGIGILRPDNGSGFQFDAERISYDFIPHVRAERVVRRAPDHPVRVGEQERTLTEMEDYLYQEKESLPLWQQHWFRAIILALFALAIMAIRLAFPTDHGYSVRLQRIQPVDPVSHHSILKVP